MPLISFDIPWKHQKNLWFSDVFRGYQKRSVAWNGFTQSQKMYFDEPILWTKLFLEIWNEKLKINSLYGKTIVDQSYNHIETSQSLDSI